MKSRSGWTDHARATSPRELDTPSEVAEAHEAFGRLRSLLPEERRGILELKAEGLSSRDIGERLGVSERTVQRVIEDLRQRAGFDEIARAREPGGGAEG